MCTVIPLATPEGIRLLEEVSQSGQCYQRCLEQVFSKQTGGTTCGIQTCALLMSASFLGRTTPDDPPTPTDPPTPPRYTIGNTIDSAAATIGSTADAIANGGGLTLSETCSILSARGCTVLVRHACDSDVDSFRAEARAAIADASSNRAAFVNYEMAVGEMVIGHHSPIGAFNAAADAFLIWDTWPATEVGWATTRDLFTAMSTTDTTSNASRGFAIVDCSRLQHD